MVPRSSAAPRTIAVIGIDGSGKTTQAHLLAEALAERGLPARYRQNAGGRHWFGRLAASVGRGDAEGLLGRRGMLVVESVLRWLAILRTLVRRGFTGEIAVMDRYAFCQYASLRVHARTRLSERFARLAYRLFPEPDITFLLVVDPEVAYERIERRGYDHEEMSYLRAAAASYESLPERPRFVVIDGNGSPEQVRADLLSAVPTGVRSRSRSRFSLVMATTLMAFLATLTYQVLELAFF